MLATKRWAGVASEVNLTECVTHLHQTWIRLPTLVWNAEEMSTFFKQKCIPVGWVLHALVMSLVVFIGEGCNHTPLPPLPFHHTPFSTPTFYHTSPFPSACWDTPPWVEWQTCVKTALFLWGKKRKKTLQIDIWEYKVGINASIFRKPWLFFFVKTKFLDVSNRCSFLQAYIT